MISNNLADWLLLQTDPEGECWMWTGSKNDHMGYGRVTIRQEQFYVHRLSYELFVGPIPEGLVIDHICRKPSCLNPDHLRAVTQRDNAVTFGESGACALNSRKTHCKHGHPFDSSNTYVRQSGHRTCRICKRRFGRESARRRKSAG